MTFGWAQASSYTDDYIAERMTETFFQANGREIDCARIYAGGESENMLGRVLQAYKNHSIKKGLLVATKAHPSEQGGLTKIGLQDQVTKSLSALQADNVDVLYLHQPDTECALTETLKGIHDLQERGLVSLTTAVQPFGCGSACRNWFCTGSDKSLWTQQLL
jgi:aflatoxin B1 aldehyde reductase